MRIGIDAHILSPEHHRHHPDVADYTKKLILSLLDIGTQNTYVLFMDARMPNEEVEQFRRPNVEIKHFPFSSYRSYLPFVYSHMLVSSILTAARLDVFHSPEGLIPYLYPGKIVATFHWVPTGYRDANVFVKTWMLGARTGFAAFSRRADAIVLRNSRDHDVLCEIHGYPETRAIVLECMDINTLDWKKHAEGMEKVYIEAATLGPRKRILAHAKKAVKRVGNVRNVRLPKLGRKKRTT